MNKILLLLLLPVFTLAQLSITDDFSDGDFTVNPAWSGDMVDFQVVSGELQMNNTSPASPADTSVLVLSSNIANSANWQFYFRFEENLTSSNYAKVYLTSDTSNLKGAVNGYFLRFGGSTSDKLSLYRQDGSSETLLTESSTGFLQGNLVEVRVEVSKDISGLWTLKGDTGAIINPLVTLGTANDQTYSSSKHFGLFCRYTTTRADKFFFDDFNLNGLPFQDLTPPVLDTVLVLSANTLELQFNEELKPVTAQLNSNYNVNGGIGQAVNAVLSGANDTVTLTFGNSFQNGISYQLSVSGVEDTAGNVASTNFNFIVNDALPFITALQVLNDSTVNLFFSEGVNSGFAGTLANFTVDNSIGNPVVSNQNTANTVALGFANKLQIGVPYRLIAEGIEDDFGNLNDDTVFFSLGQINIFDNFSDGDFTVNPSWQGDTFAFEVDSVNQLQLNDTAAGEAYLSTRSSIIDNAFWEFYLRLEFATSSQNFARVYLSSDDSVLTDTLNGYYLLIGGTDDEVSLYRQDGTSSTAVLQSPSKFIDTDPVELKVRISRDDKGLWSLEADTALNGSYLSLGSATDSVHRSSFYFGPYCKYSSTRADKFYFDDFNLSGEAYVDLSPPRVDSVKIITNNALEVLFSESVTEITARTTGNYSVNNGIGSPATALWNTGDPRRVILSFINTFQNKTSYELYVKGVEDLFGNPSDDTVGFSYLSPEAGDVVINEIMPDPSPVVGFPPNALPEREYLELYNRTNVAIDLRDWVLTIGSSTEVLPTYLLEPDSFVVITRDEGVVEFPPGLPLLGLDMSSTALTNSGNTVSLQSPTGEIISTVSYTDEWYNDPGKDEGGWSMEQIDAENLCGGIDNWRASTDPVGGTPGRPNSVSGINPDTVAPAFERIAIAGDSSVVVFFTERVERSVLQTENNYIVDPAITIDQALPLLPSLDQVTIHFSEAIDPNTIYTLTLNDYPLDCAGNLMLADTLIFAVPAFPEEGDILINEILFNPPSGGSDFVELYNNSDKVFDLNKLRLGNWDAAFRAIEDPEELREESFLFEPGRYLALTTDPAFLEQQYILEQPKNIVEVLNLPSMGDSEGSVAVATSNLLTVDHFEYEDDLHLAVIDNDEGISLERISFSKATRDDDNWQSAASTAGYATPGYENSQYFIPKISAEINLDPKVFSPNQDGYRDVLAINYEFDQTNNVISISIWNSGGLQVKELVQNENVSQTGFFTWDGTGDNGQLLNTGIYIVIVEYFNQDGQKEIVRQTCVLSL